MSDVKLGQLIGPDAQRDAIHIAIAPVIAMEPLEPGMHIGLCDSQNGVSQAANSIGIVDPFLRKGVDAGDRFYMFLYPQTVTGMRHEWQHPAFNRADIKAASEKWLRDFCKTADCPDYETVIAAAVGKPVPIIDEAYGRQSYRLEDYGDGPMLFFNGRDAHSEIPPEFWNHVEVVTGVKVPQEKRAVGFACSC